MLKKRTIFFICLIEASFGVWLIWVTAALAASDKSLVNLYVGEYCSDNIVNGVEQCDDGNLIDGDGCTSTCLDEFCGDAIINNNGEVCDGNNQACVTSGYVGTQLCNGACDGWNACVSAQFCGDGFVNGFEACDDGNNIDCDGCRSDCTRLDNICGDGYLDCVEECDGSLGITAGFYCDNACHVERASAGSSIFSSVWLDILDIYERINPTEVVINWKTSKLAQCSVYWGMTPELQSEQMQEVEKKDTHRAFISDLLPDTVYYYMISCHDSWGQKSETTPRKVITKELDDKIPPANVSGFAAKLDGVQVVLTWNNPIDNDFQGVKLVRNSVEPVFSPLDGTALYLGRGDSYRDMSLALGKRYYYTIFTYDNSGNYSSGAIAYVDIPKEAVLPEEITGHPQEYPTGTTTDGTADKPIDTGNGKTLDSQGGTDTNPSDAAEKNIKLASDKIAFMVNDSVEAHFSDDNTLSLFPDMTTSVSFKDEFSYKDDFVPSITIKDGKSQNIGQYIFKRSEDGVFSAVLRSPQNQGEYSIEIGYFSQGIYYGTLYSGKMIVKEYGRVVRKRFFQNAYIPLKNVRIELRMINENGSHIRWPGEDYQQANPVITDISGLYGFFVPNGKYSLEIYKDGYYPIAVSYLQVNDHIINQNFIMIYAYDFDWRLILSFLVLIVLLVYVIFRIIIIKKRNKDNILYKDY